MTQVSSNLLDDLDVSMMRNDYEKFLELAPAIISEQYEIISWADEGYAHPFIKIIKKGTIYKEDKDGSNNSKNGIYIDVFPYDIFPENRKKQLSQGSVLMFVRAIIRAKCKCKTWKTHKGVNIVKYIKNIPIRVISIFLDKKTAVKLYEKTSIKYNREKSNYLFINGAFKYGEEIHNAECFSKFANYEFEGEYFKGPLNSDRFLKELYGDYMQLPPEEERYNRHMIVELSFGEENQ